MRQPVAAVLTVLVLQVACSEGDDPMSPESLAGTYPLAQVNGGALAVFHPVQAFNCQAAFQSGGLEIHADDSFRLDLNYYYQCSEPSPNDGPGSLIVTGSEARVVGNALYLEGCGPPTTMNACPPWSLEVRAASPDLTVQFLDNQARFWGDPVFTMGPRQD
jgi:hypothetical protein